MRLSVVTSDVRGWFAPFARELVERLAAYGTSELLDDHCAVPCGGIAFFLSYERIVPARELGRSRNNIVVHASALPHGRGMSPLTWQILEGRDTIPVTLFEAVERLDAGPVYLRDAIRFEGTELLPEMRSALGAKIVDLCVTFASRYPAILDEATEQVGAASRYRARKPRDSELDPERSICEQFDLLRVVDNERYPAFFRWKGRTYRLLIEAADE